MSLTKLAAIAYVTSLFATVRSVAADALAALPAIQQQQAQDLQKEISDLQSQLSAKQAAFSALQPTQAADLQAAQQKVADIDTEQDALINYLTAGLPADQVDPAAPVPSPAAAA